MNLEVAILNILSASPRALPALAIIFDGYRPPVSYYVLVPIMLFGVALTGGVFDPAPQTGPAT